MKWSVTFRAPSPVTLIKQEFGWPLAAHLRREDGYSILALKTPSQQASL